MCRGEPVVNWHAVEPDAVLLQISKLWMLDKSHRSPSHLGTGRRDRYSAVAVTKCAMH